MPDNTTPNKSLLSQLDATLEEYLVKKAPFTLPPNVKEAIVKFGPWITLILLILTLPAILLFLGLGTLVLPFSYLGGIHAGLNYTVSMIFSLIVLVLEVIALPGLFSRSKSGWNFVYYATLLTAVENILTFNLGGLIIGTTLSLYILYQVKEYYK